MSGLLGAHLAGRAGDARLREHLPLAVFRLRGLRHPAAEGRPLRHQAGPALLPHRLREGSRDAARLRAR